MDFEEVFGMSLYDNDSYSEEFMEEVYKLLADDPDNSRANEIIDLFDNAPEFNPPNEPLTLEQLREMDGEPVWVEFEDGSGGLWGIVHITIFAQIVFANGLHCTIGERYYGKSYKAYRRPPEGEEDQHGDHHL